MSKLNVTSIVYGRKFNNRDFDSSHIELTVDLYKEDDPVEVFDELTDMVMEFRRAENKRIRKEGQ